MAGRTTHTDRTTTTLVVSPTIV